MKKKDNLESQLLGKHSASDYENEIENQIDEEISQARAENARKKNCDENQVVITDISKIRPEEKFDRNTIYRVFNRKQKTETFVNGEQAETILKYTDDYVVRFDHRVVCD